MEFLTRTFSDLINRFSPVVRRNSIQMDSNRKNAYLNAVYKVLVGDNPRLNFMALAVLIVLLRVIQFLELRFYGVLCLTCMMAVLCDYFFEKNEFKAVCNASANEALQQIKELLAGIISHLCCLRRNNPLSFCTALCGVFLSFLVIANNLSGYSFVYITASVVFLTPLIFHKIPPEYITNVGHMVTNTIIKEGIIGESEFFPCHDNNLNDQESDLESLLTDRTAESVTNSLISGISSMPSHLDAEGTSLDGLEEEDLEFVMRSTRAPISGTPGDLSSDSDSDPKSMNFESSHFNGDSSSEEENFYVKGLQFSEVSEDFIDNSKTKTGHLLGGNDGILSNLSVISNNVISNVFKSAILYSTSKTQDSDSDFEIIDSDEVDNNVRN